MSRKRFQIGGRRADNTKEAVPHAHGQGLVDTVHSRLSGHPFNEPSEEIRGGLLLLLIAILKHGEHRAALADRMPGKNSAGSPSSIWPDNTTEATNPYPVEGCEDIDVATRDRSQEGSGNDEESANEDMDEEKKKRQVWQVGDDCVDGLAQCATKALADRDPHNKQLACRLIVLLTKCMRFDALSRKHVLDALQYLIASSLLGRDCMDKLMTGLSSLVEDEVAPAIRYKICACVGFWFLTLPVRYLKPHMSKLVAFLLACIAAEDERVKRYGARVLRCIAAPCLFQLKQAGLSAVGNEPKGTRESCSRQSSRSGTKRASEAVGDPQMSDASSDSSEEIERHADPAISAGDRELLEKSWTISCSSPEFLECSSTLDTFRDWFKDRVTDVLPADWARATASKEEAEDQLLHVSALLSHFAEETVAWVLATESALWRFSPEPLRSQRSLQTLTLLLGLLPPPKLVPQLPEVLAYLCKTCQHVDSYPFSQAHPGAEPSANPPASRLVSFMLSLASGEAEAAWVQVHRLSEDSASQAPEFGESDGNGEHLAAPRGTAKAPTRQPIAVATRLLRDALQDNVLSAAPSAMKGYLEVLRDVLACAETVATLVPPPFWLSILAGQMQTNASVLTQYEKALEQRLQDSVPFSYFVPTNEQKIHGAAPSERPSNEISNSRKEDAPSATTHSQDNSPSCADTTTGDERPLEERQQRGGERRSGADEQQPIPKAFAATTRVYPLLLLSRMLATVDAPQNGARGRECWSELDAAFCVDLIGQFVQPSGESERSPRSLDASVDRKRGACEDAFAFFGVSGPWSWSGAASDSKAEDACLAYAAVCVASAVTACRDACHVRWPRLIAILLRLRVASEVPPGLIDTCVHLLSVYSGKSPQKMYCAYLEAFIEADRHLASELNAVPPGTPLETLSMSSLEAPWSLSDPRRLILLHVLQELRVAAGTAASQRQRETVQATSSANKGHIPTGRPGAQKPAQRMCAAQPSCTASDASRPLSATCQTTVSPGELRETRTNFEETSVCAGSPTNTEKRQRHSQNACPRNCRGWLPGLLSVLEIQACPDTVAPGVRVDTLAILFELYANADLANMCLANYASFVVNAIILPNLRWRPGEANAKLRKAALACLSAVIGTLTETEHLPGRATRASSPATGDSTTEPSAPASPPHCVDGLDCAADQVATPLKKTEDLMRLLESLLPCLLSCLEDDGQPDTRTLTADILARLFAQLKRTVCASSDLGVAPSSPSSGAGASRASPEKLQHPSAALCGQSAETEGLCCPSGRGQTVACRGRHQGYVGLCSALYAALLQRLDDARSGVRLAAAHAIREMLLLLLELKRDSAAACETARRHTISDAAPAESLSGDESTRAETEARVPTESEALDTVSAHISNAGESAGDLPGPAEARRQGPEETETESGRNEASASCRKWTWPCLEFLMKGLVTFVDDKDEELATTVAAAMEIGGKLDADLLLREASTVVGQSLFCERYEALAEFAKQLLQNDTVLNYVA
ncbi:conserved hypothetical protein [Neospora caninum Liverpool]|nr:conserved hypothetical protein [Neospora caninum Liverpool]CBZ49802.1 conserved hypothetical protein [Neospora caninum Liverpool]|eukprot:XP_003879837.1 conserved hypothetical protein [Neospora caninum Liverpool]